MKTRKILALVLSLVMVLSLCGSALAAPHTSDEVTELEAANSDLAKELAGETYVLLENNGALPIAKEGAVALFGSASQITVKGGTGSGDVNQRAHDNIGEAFEAAGYTIANPTWYAKMTASPQPSSCLGTSPKVDLEITDEELAEATAATDTCVYAIARNAGEGSDRQVNSGNGSYNLTDVELANVKKLSKAFDKFIVVYNTLVMDTSWQAGLDIDAVLFMGNGGQRGSEALVETLNGTVNPSGKLTDTWALRYSDYPAADGFASADGNINTEWYEEGIYMGYRYFDTFGLDVKYPFGYGLSYTDFDITVNDVTADAEYVTVDATVSNVGEYTGKEVVEVYFSAPDGELEKPYQELAAYVKTGALAPGAAQDVTLSFKTTDMSSYSEERAAYILDAGDYVIRVGNSSRDTKAVAVINIDGLAVTEQLSNQLALEDGAVLDELSKEGATPIANNDAVELASAKKIELAAADFETVNNASTNDAETITTYLFKEDAENYTPRKGITLRTKTVAGIINNAEYPDGDGVVNDNGPAYNGYSETVYDEVVEVLDDLPEGITKENAKLTDVYDGKITLKQFVACLSAYELARLCVGGAESTAVAEGNEMVGAQASMVRGGAGQTTDALFYTRAIPAMPNSDGPAGIRITQHYEENGVDYYQFCTAFPVGTNIAMSWDVDVYEAFGKAIGAEMIEYNVTTWLAPGMDMHRDPLCGRNFEYYSEDPLVAGLTAAYTTLGVQSHSGIGVTLKHFWGNEQEDNRNALNNVIGERAAREIYLKQFEIAVKLAQPQCMMNCYNENNGWPGSDSWDVNEDILREEWGFKGYVMTDWGGGQSTDFIAKHGGCDVVMPGGNPTTILSGYVGEEPTFNKDGTIKSAGRFTPDPHGEVSYKVTVVVPGAAGNAWMGIPDEPDTPVYSFEDLPESVQEGVKAGYIDFYLSTDGRDSYIVWFGNLDKDFSNDVNRISLGDLQKSALRILAVDLISQDMEKMLAENGVEYTAGSYSENCGALALQPDFVPYGAKGQLSNVEAIIAAEDVVETDTVKVYKEWGRDLTTVRLTIGCALPITEIQSENDFEFNPETGAIVVYKADGTDISDDLFTIIFDITDAEGKYPVDLSIIQVTRDDHFITAAAKDGSLTFPVNYGLGDVNRDGSLDNRDLIMIARYLVELEEFDDEQKILADFNVDSLIDNLDLVLIARELVKA